MHDVEPVADDAQDDVPADASIGEEVDVRQRELGPRVDAEVRLGEEEDAGDGAVWKDEELLADDGRPTRIGGGVEERAKSVLIREDRRVADPRVERVERHLNDSVLLRAARAERVLDPEQFGLLRLLDVEASQSERRGRARGAWPS